MSPELLSSMAGAGLSLLASYVPGVKQAYEKLGNTGKRFVMALAVILAAIASSAWACSSPDTKEALDVCLAGGWRTYAQNIFVALTVNQATHRITPGDSETVRVPKKRKVKPVRRAR